MVNGISFPAERISTTGGADYELLDGCVVGGHFWRVGSVLSTNDKSKWDVNETTSPRNHVSQLQCAVEYANRAIIRVLEALLYKLIEWWLATSGWHFHKYIRPFENRFLLSCFCVHCAQADG